MFKKFTRKNPRLSLLPLSIKAIDFEFKMSALKHDQICPYFHFSQAINGACKQKCCCFHLKRSTSSASVSACASASTSLDSAQLMTIPFYISIAGHNPQISLLLGPVFWLVLWQYCFNRRWHTTRPSEKNWFFDDTINDD